MMLPVTFFINLSVFHLVCVLSFIWSWIKIEMHRKEFVSNQTESLEGIVVFNITVISGISMLWHPCTPQMCSKTFLHLADAAKRSTPNYKCCFSQFLHLKTYSLSLPRKRTKNIDESSRIFKTKFIDILNETALVKRYHGVFIRKNSVVQTKTNK